jgi:hypothetical protein
MPGFFSAEDVINLNKAKDDAHQKFNVLRDKLAARTYKTLRGREYAFTGLIRRLDTMICAIDLVFDILPPEKEDIPSTDDTVPATMLIQSFVINVQGCLDNLAWIWVFETGLKDRDGKELQRRAVGLGDDGYWIVRKSFSKPFQKYLKLRKKWFKHVAEFRDSLAHRIPLYIMPFILSETNSKKYYRLEKEAFEAGLKGAYQAYDKLKAQQQKLGAYRPWMTHSPAEKAPAAVFHQQLLQDFLTIDECANRILEELAVFEQRTMASSANPVADILRRWLRAAHDFLCRLRDRFRR